MPKELTNVTFDKGETWTLDPTMHDSAGLPLNISAATVTWKLVKVDDTPITTLSIGSGITLVNGGNGGECLIVLTPAQQISLGIVPGFYQHEAQVVLADGTVTDQFYGFVQVLDTLF
jgi:hypothetical protein